MEVKIVKNMIDGTIYVNPTGGKIRSDSGGDGSFGASRRGRLHDGLDFECWSGQPILMPVSGRIVRPSYPYKYDDNYQGVYIHSNRIDIKMWYMIPFPDRIGSYYEAGVEIGFAQDISKKYSEVTPHIHLRIVKIDPMFLFKI